jgi:fumarate reductase subunit D
MLATIVETGDLLKTIAASVIAGVGLTCIFSVAIWGATRYTEHSHDERPLAAGAAGALAVLGFLATLAAVVFGIVVMTQK